MSHSVERKEKNCLNCNAEVYGRYCHLCGQENVVPAESFTTLVTHFVYDITHFDSKFFSSLKYLLFKPGYLSWEYIKGRRASYLNPVKMYVFISAIFFLFFFSVVNQAHIGSATTENQGTVAEVRQRITDEMQQMEAEMNEKDHAPENRVNLSSNIALLRQDLSRLQRDSTRLNELNYFKFQENILSRSGLNDLQQYDSVQARLSPARKDRWLKRTVIRRVLATEGKYGHRTNFLEKLLDKFRHTFPQLLFVSLPLIALLLKVLYGGKRKFYYTDHVVYGLHLYCATFVLMFLVILFSHFADKAHLKWLDYLIGPIVLYILWYHYRSLRNFYQQGRWITVIKYVLLLMMSGVVMSALFFIFLLFSFLNM